MPRVKRGYTLRRRRKRLLKLAKGFRGPRGNLYRIAKEAVDRALSYAYRDRRTRKRDFRRLWITRINAAARSNDISYSRFISGLTKANVAIDRKILADMAINDPGSFTQLAAIARGN
jgi:large subunit ribosomal protein L20